jgi:hypothetical protein
MTKEESQTLPIGALLFHTSTLFIRQGLRVPSSYWLVMGKQQRDVSLLMVRGSGAQDVVSQDVLAQINWRRIA